MTRLEKIIENIQKRMEDETFNRVKLKFLSTNVDRDIRVEYDSEDETYFVEKHKHIFDRYVCSFIYYTGMHVPKSYGH